MQSAGLHLEGVETVDRIAAEIRHSLDAMPRKDVPSVRRLRRVWSRRLMDWPGTSIIALARRLIRLGMWERGMAYEIIVHRRAALKALTQGDVVHFGRGMHIWGEVDSFARYVA